MHAWSEPAVHQHVALQSRLGSAGRVRAGKPQESVALGKESCRIRELTLCLPW